MEAPCGLFGKLRFRGDFVALGLAPAFLSAWEPWLQAGLATSRATLGADWTAAFLTMPVWRFRLGAGLTGSETAGALMPSLDAAGRCFPLTLAFACPPGEGLAGDGEAAGAGWFDAAEALLLFTLADEATLEAAQAGLRALPAPPTAAGGLSGGSLWWTRGGEAAAPARFAEPAGLPSPERFTAMLGGARRRALAEGEAG